MRETNAGVTRRRFLKTAIVVVGAAALPVDIAAGAQGSAAMAVEGGPPDKGSAKYRRFNVMSDGEEGARELRQGRRGDA